jgi:tetratricopeptide (TPR) repeat protein
MTSPNIDLASEYLRRSDFAAALAEFRAVCEASPNNWYAWYGAGQAARFLDDFGTACNYLKRAMALAPTRPSTRLALGIALQLDGKLQSASWELEAAIQLDADLVEAFNSLGITHKKMGAFDKALDAFSAGRKALARRLVKQLHNDIHNPIVKLGDPVGTRWADCASFGALWLASDAGAASISWPTGETAIEEETTERHGGLYFVDRVEGAGFVRVFLPNYFGSFRRWLQESPVFANLVGNEGAVWDLMGKSESAKECFEEARALHVPLRTTLAWTPE